MAFAAPHSCIWVLGLVILAEMDFYLEVVWLGMLRLFRWPFGWFFSAIGGIPVRRGQGMNYMQQLTDLFDRSEHLVLALAPEGTRGKTDHWKTGFHYIARAAKVPILMAYLDYGNKVVGIGGQFYPGEDIHADFRKIAEYYKDRRGKYPDKESLIRVREKNR